MSAKDHRMSDQETEHEMVKCPECGALLRGSDSSVGCPVCLSGIRLRENRENGHGEQPFAERYRIDSFMGRGGMGQVFKAVDSQLGREVAIKLLVGNRYQDHEKVKRFRQEALSLSKVNHPNVCTIHDVGVSAEGPYIVMELVHGQTIGELVKGAAMPVNQTLDLMLQACRGIHAIHAKGIVHRDIKPSNVMVATGNLVKIVDFGLATRASRRCAEGTAFEVPENTLTDEVQTIAGHIVGTPNYMSPEQASGRLVDARTDVFSLGAVFYVMLTGTPPFQAETPMLTMHAIISREYRPIRDRNPEVPEAMAGLVDKMLADIEERFVDFAEVMEALEIQMADSALENTPAMASDASRVDVNGTHSPRVQSKVVPIRAVLVAVILFCMLFLGVWLRTGRREPVVPVNPVWRFKADHAMDSYPVEAVVIEPAANNNQKSGARDTSGIEHEFVEWLKTSITAVLVENAVPLRAFDGENWSNITSVSRAENGSLDFQNAVSSLLRENDANLFITISGYFEPMGNTHQFDVSFLNAQGDRVQSSHLVFEDQAIKGRDDVVLRETLAKWFDENFVRASAGE